VYAVAPGFACFYKIFSLIGANIYNKTFHYGHFLDHKKWSRLITVTVLYIFITFYFQNFFIKLFPLKSVPVPSSLVSGTHHSALFLCEFHYSGHFIFFFSVLKVLGFEFRALYLVVGTLPFEPFCQL
jgi:hypothetical protein